VFALLLTLYNTLAGIAVDKVTGYVYVGDELTGGRCVDATMMCQLCSSPFTDFN
jgi:hypothetical protein